MTRNEEPGDKVIYSPRTVASHLTLNNSNEQSQKNQYMVAFHQHWNINPHHVDVECRRQYKILQFFSTKWNSFTVIFVMTTNEEPDDKVIYSLYTVAFHFTMNNSNKQSQYIHIWKHSTNTEILTLSTWMSSADDSPKFYIFSTKWNSFIVIFVMTTNEEPGDKVIYSPYTVACHFTLNDGNELSQ